MAILPEVCLVHCHCNSGCPSCVGPLGEVDAGARDIALDLADWLSLRIPQPRGPDRVRAPQPSHAGGASLPDPRQP